MLSFWEKNSFVNYDYIIVGSGILGLSTACCIKEKFPESRILILERGIFPTGASTKNAGFLCFGSITEMLADINNLGEDAAVSIVEKRWRGINLLLERLGKEKIGYLNYGGYELINDKHIDAPDKIDYLNKILRGTFGDNVFEIKNEKITEFGFNNELVKLLVYSPFESQIDTGLLMRSLISYAASLGITILNGCNVTGYESNGEIVKVTVDQNNTEENVTVSAVKLIICANAFTFQIVVGTNIKPGRGHVILTKPIDGLKFKGVFRFDEGFYYFRNYENRVMFGGGRNLDFETEATGEFGFNDKILTELENKLTNIILPNQKFEIDDKWTGIMGFTEDRLPAITEINSNVYSLVSCNGMGIALSSYIAKEMTEKF